MENVLSYKGFVGSLQVSLEDNCLFGRIMNIIDLVTYEGNTVDEARRAFEESVEHYLRTCAELELPAERVAQRPATAVGGDG